MSEKKYINSLRCKKSNFGIKISGNAQKLIEEINQHTNERGYINLELKERKNPSEDGITHYIEVNNYQAS